MKLVQDETIDDNYRKFYYDVHQRANTWIHKNAPDEVIECINYLVKHCRLFGEQKIQLCQELTDKYAEIAHLKRELRNLKVCLGIACLVILLLILL